MHGFTWSVLYMIKQKGFNDSHGIVFWISFYFFQKFDISAFVDLGVNLEVLKLLHLCMVCHEVCFQWWNKWILMISRKLIFECHFILFFHKFDLSVFVDLEKFQPWCFRSELLKSKNFFTYAWIVMKFALKDKAKGFSWLSGDGFWILMLFLCLNEPNMSQLSPWRSKRGFALANKRKFYSTVPAVIAFLRIFCCSKSQVP